MCCVSSNISGEQEYLYIKYIGEPIRACLDLVHDMHAFLRECSHLYDVEHCLCLIICECDDVACELNDCISAPPPRTSSTARVEPCNPTPCGENARCLERNHAAACMCMDGFFGDPYTECRPECTVHSDCLPSRACQEFLSCNKL